MSAESGRASGWDTAYEWRAVALLGAGFGLVGLDRWIIAPLFPFIAADLGLTEADAGRLAGILGILWGVFALLGLALGTLIATQLLSVVPSWRWVFWIVAIPGFVVGLLLLVVLREPADTQGGKLIGATQASGRWLDVLRVPNIIVCMVAPLSAMSCVFVLSAMVA